MALVLYPFTSKYVQIIEVKIDTQIQVLVNEMYQSLLVQSKLAPFVYVIENNSENVFFL